MLPCPREHQKSLLYFYIQHDAVGSPFPSCGWVYCGCSTLECIDYKYTIPFVFAMGVMIADVTKLCIVLKLYDQRITDIVRQSLVLPKWPLRSNFPGQENQITKLYTERKVYWWSDLWRTLILYSFMVSTCMQQPVPTIIIEKQGTW